MQKPQVNHPLTLCQSSSIEISKLLWSQPDLKHQLILWIKTHSIWSSSTESTDAQNTLRAQISRKINELVPSERLKQELRQTVDLMGTRLRQWIHKMERRGNISVDLILYLDHIHWGRPGCVDESATINSMYLSQVFPENIITWLELCDYCLEDCIRDLWPKLSEIEENFYTRSQSVLSTYWCHWLQNDLKKGHATFRIVIPDWEDDQSLEENLFAYSFLYGTYSAVEYFWRLMRNDQRKRTIIRVARTILSFIELLPQPDLVVFLLQQIFFYDLNHLWIQLLNSDRLLVKLLNWPYQHLFLAAAEASWVHHGPIDYTPILIEIIKSMKSLCLFSTDGAHSQYCEIVYDILERVVGDKKGSINFLKVLNEAWEMENNKMLNYIINYPRLEEMRNFHVFVMMQAFKRRHCSVDSDFGEKFVREVLVSDAERESFRCQVKDRGFEIDGGMKEN
ncbi:uncharacterized protein LOC107036126 [Diachasma alloeum]|uniref:uncharacterized protein LOC107036126 n=1 Tax=Diachasma alloeum TaxID=454923 RepID=UPI0007382BFE|nr:uncharacterized protein LOC107036126 [Diachasma alloeum]